MTGHEKIMKLRQDLDIPEEKSDPEEDRVWEKMRQLRLKRMETVDTDAEYMKKYNREPYTDKWLGPGIDPDLAIVTKSKEEAKKLHKQSINEWRAKYTPNVNTIHLAAEKPESKKIRKLRKKRKDHENREKRQEQYELAYWYLEEFLIPEKSAELYDKYAGRLELLVDRCCELAISWQRDMANPKKHLTPEQAYLYNQQKLKRNSEVVYRDGPFEFKRIQTSEAFRKKIDIDPVLNPIPDIPDAYWDEFLKWSDEEPLSKYKKMAKKYNGRVSVITLRRCAFLKKVNKRNRGWRKSMMLHDPITGAAFVSEKKMKENIQKQMHKYDKKRQEMVAMLDKMVAKGEVSEDYANHIMGDTKLVRDRVKKRYNEAYKRNMFHYEEQKKEAERQERLYKARKKWYEKNGVKIDDPPFKVDFPDGDGGNFSVEAKGGRWPVYKLYHNDKLKSSGESLYGCLDLDIKPDPIPDPPKPWIDTKEWMRGYAEAPDY